MADNFDNPFSANLIGLWDFRDGFNENDTGLGDGIAQDGVGSATTAFSGGWMIGNGSDTRFDVEGSQDAPFDLAEGTMIVELRPDLIGGGGDRTVVSRGLENGADSDGNYFTLNVTEDGAIEITHADGGNAITLETDPGFFASGDVVKVAYSWSEGGQTMVVENTTQGTVARGSSEEFALTLDVAGAEENSFTIGAAEDGSQAYSGQIDYVAVLDEDVITTGGLDGIVEGTGGDDLIDTGYTGDPEGDRVDADDAIDPAAAPDDDVINGAGGDDTIIAGEADDVAHGGSGSDSIAGGEGNDRLEGDTDAPGAGGTSREVFQWDLAPDPDDGGEVDPGDDLSGGFSQNTGNVTVDFAVSTPGATGASTFGNGTQFVGNIDTGGADADPNSGLGATLSQEGDTAGYTLDFSDPVGNVSFRVNDIDGDSQVQITAYDADGTPIKVNLAGGPGLVLSDTDSVGGNDTADNSDPGAFASSDNPNQSLLVTIPGPVSSIVITHTQGGPVSSGIDVSDVYFDALTIPGDIIPGDDTLDGGEGNDTLIGNDGNDSLIGGGGDDSIDASGNEPLPLPDRGFPGYGDTTPPIPPVPADSDPFDDRDTVDGGSGNDTIATGDDADLVMGGSGDDVINAGIDDDTVDGGADDDEITGGEGSDSLRGGAGNDTIFGGLDPVFPDGLNIMDDGADGRAVDPDPTNGMDTIDGGSGDDVIYGQDDDDLITGGIGNDYVDAGIDDDTVDGGTGDDTILGGHGTDDLTGGEGSDSITGGAGNDTIRLEDDDDAADVGVGGFGSDTFTGLGQGDTVRADEDLDDGDIDILDLRTAAEAQNPGGSLSVEFFEGEDESGTVTFFDAEGEETGTAEFYDVEQIIMPCFTPGTLIATPEGERRVEELQSGDRVITRDNGIQQIRWVGRRDLAAKELRGNGHLQPILIRQGALGNGLPERDMMVSPNHRVLVANDKTALYFEDREVLVAAKHLIGLEGIDAVETSAVSYIHFMFDQHEVVLSDGAWTESFQPGDQTLRGLDSDQRNEVYDLFPDLKTDAGRETYGAARRSLKKHEARLLVH